MSSAFGRTLLAATSLLGALSPVVAEAEGAAAKDQMGGIEEIVVTAQKRAENLQDVPVAIGRQAEVGCYGVRPWSKKTMISSVSAMPAARKASSKYSVRKR